MSAGSGTSNRADVSAENSSQSNNSAPNKEEKTSSNDGDDGGQFLPNLYDRFVRSLEQALPERRSKQKLDSLSIDGVANYIKDGKARNIIVMAGAGISTSAGVPDFRSPGTGLYDNLEEYNLPDPMAVFDIGYFKKNPKPFFRLARKLFPRNIKPTKAHYFIRLLELKGLLRRCFTQNIDSLEYVANISEEKIVTAHGSHRTSTCLRCKRVYDLKWITEKITQSEPEVILCDVCKGVVKPDIIFFGEKLPERFFRCAISDFPQCDLLIIMGTSLVVQPFASMVNEVKDDVPRLLINLTEAGKASACERAFGMPGLDYGSKSNYRDVFWKGNCDDGCRKLAELLGWENELEKLMREEWNRLDTVASAQNKAFKAACSEQSSNNNEKAGEPSSSEEKNIK
ncbi:hypothetical protein AB6A40_002139 [Gnathostoma spinigerum]|uniref:NAD-dependent protein deacetylase n=1 Tax=Gnathostoma spinigerum TaxID=75299 RepID=A0ABD6E6W5_9BILA